MNLCLKIILLFATLYTNKFIAQQNNLNFLDLTLSIGKTSPPNYNFPELNAQKSIVLAFGKTNFDTNLEWAKQLNYPETGITLSYTDFGNTSVLGRAISVTPFLDYKLFDKQNFKINMKTELGFSYFNKTFDSSNDKVNKAISTNFTWAFRTNLSYEIHKKNNLNLRIGIGYFHNSNGHLRLPNNGLNVFTVNLSSKFNIQKNPIPNSVIDSTTCNVEKKDQKFYSFRFGLGQKVFTELDIVKKEVYILSVSKGVIVNKTFKFGYGFSYRFYKDYYDFINKDSGLLSENNPNFFASNFALFASSEILLSHIGIELELGLNLYKPAYKYEYELINGKYVNEIYQKPELNWYYDIKKTISSRFGLKYYLFNTNNLVSQNIFLGGFINANLGQADYSELTLGYVYSMDFIKKKDNRF